MKQPIKIEIMDCTLRDGGYINNWQFDKKLAREVYRSLSKSGVDYVELGFRGSAKYFDPAVYGAWRFSTEDNLREVVQGIEGAKIAIMGDYGKLDLDDLDERANSVVHLVRVAAHKNQIFQALDFIEKIKKKGYLTSIQAMAFATYSDQEKLDLKKALENSGIDYFYIADSYGAILPDGIGPLLAPFIGLKNIRVGFHPHNNLQMAFANTLEAIKAGVDIIDCTIYGMGRGAGNLPTEVIISYLGVRGNGKYNVIPVLNCVDNYFLDLMKEMPWGYQLPYMISGMFKCHPTYATELLKMREYSIEDIWRALDVIEEIKPIGFNRNLLQKLIESRVLGTQALGRKTVNKEKKGVAKPPAPQPVPYIGRHTGRDFLVLANGPTLKEYQGQIQEFITRYCPVILGANYLSELFVPHYHAFNNKKRFINYVDTVSPQSQLLIGENIPESMIEAYVRRDYEKIYFRDLLNTDFDIQKGRIMSNCRTISVLLVGVAIVMGAKRIFIAGMDGYLEKSHIQCSLFYDENAEPGDLSLKIDRHRWNERFLIQINKYVQDRQQEGIHIITPTSHSVLYKGMENYI